MSKLNTFLAGVKVLDLSQYIPGPMASLYLADMGAEVIKVEPPSGDEMRNLGPRGHDGQPIFYEALNAGKTVCRLDLKSSSGYATLIDLLGEADVLIEGFRPGVMARLKFDEKGRRVSADIVVVQWRDGEPILVYPPDIAAQPAKWAKP